jgi:hypothetical protein
MTPKQFQQKLIELDACQEAREWAEGKSWEEVYNTCHRGDWLLWLAEKQGVDKPLLILVGGHCANTVRHLMTDPRSTHAVDTAIAYGEGRARKDELKKARGAAVAAAWAAAWAATDAAAVAAAWAAAWAATDAAAVAAAWAAARAAAWAAERAAAWAVAGAAAVAAAADVANQQATADIVRKYIPIEKFGL